jgi:hypothetical protein
MIRNRIGNRNGTLQSLALLAGMLSLAGSLWAQDAPKKILVVNGKTVDAVILEVEGRSYVDIQSLADNANGTVAFETDRVVMTLPAAGAVVVAASAAAASAGPATPEPVLDSPPAEIMQALTKGFAGAANATLENIKEWQGALGTMVTYGLAAGGSWAQNYHDRAVASLVQATAATSSDSDQSTLLLLNAEVDNLTKWAGDVFAERQALNAARTVDPNSLRNDPVLGKISDCATFLGAMIVSGVFSDNPSCH